MWRGAVIVVAILLSGVDLARGQAVRGAAEPRTLLTIAMQTMQKGNRREYYPCENRSTRFGAN